MPFRTPWPQPYPELKTLPTSAVHTLRVDIPRSDLKPIYSLATSPAIFSLICQHAIKSAAEHIRANNLTYLDADEFVQWIRERTAGRTPAQAAGSNVPGGDTGVRPGTADSAVVAPVVGEDAAVESGAGRDGGLDYRGSVGPGDGSAGKPSVVKRKPKIKAE